MSKRNRADPLAGVSTKQVQITRPPAALPPSQAETTTVSARLLNAEARALKAWAREHNTSINALLGILIRLFLHDTAIQRQTIAGIAASDRDAKIAQIKRALAEDPSLRAQVLEEMTEE